MPTRLIDPTNLAADWTTTLWHQLTAQAGDAVSGFDWPLWLHNFKLALEILSVILLVVFVTIIFKIRTLFRGQAQLLKTEPALTEAGVPTVSPYDSPYDQRWAEIRRHVQSFNAAEWKLAVIEADKFIDDALKTAGYPGETMGERLMLVQPGQLLSLQTLWDAHKLRNLLVHDANYQLAHRQAVLAIEAFETTLRELGALS